MPHGSAIMEPPTYTKEVYVDSARVVGTGQVQVPPDKFQIWGHIASILFDYTATVVIGTGVITATPATSGIARIVIRDRNNKEIINCTGAQLSRLRKLLTIAPSLGNDEYRKGEFDAGTNMTSAGGNVRVELPIHIPPRYQPCTVEYTNGVLADFLGTVGTATVTTDLRISTKNYVVALTAEQERIAHIRRAKVENLPTITTEQSFQNRLLEKSVIERFAIDAVADANITDYTFKVGGTVGFEKLLERVVQMIEARAFDDGHTPAGFYVLPIHNIVVTDQVELRLNPSTSVAPLMYQLYTLPAEE